MTTFSNTFANRRDRNAIALAAFGLKDTCTTGVARYRTVREGIGATIYTVGYEKRDGDELVSILRDAGVRLLIDVRDKPISRKPDFRENALDAICSEAKIKYESWKDLGSTESQRDRLKETGDFEQFSKEFTRHAKQHMNEVLQRLTAKIRNTKGSIALLCYERCHDDCHRSLLAKWVAEELDGSIVAIL